MEIQKVQSLQPMLDKVMNSAYLNKMAKTMTQLFNDTVCMMVFVIQEIVENPYFAAAFVVTLSNVSRILSFCCIVGMAVTLILRMEP